MLKLSEVDKTYQLGATTVHALRGVSLTIDDGDFVAIMGPSGSGKSTLMHVLGLLDTPTAGSYQIDGIEAAALSDDAQAILRRKKIGFIFQQFHLLARMTAAQNVALPLIYSESRTDVARGTSTLGRVGLTPRAEHKPNELSGGQQQRVAIARALINQPRILLADEPTGNLDSTSEAEVLAILHALNAEGITIVVVTHAEEVGAQARRRIRMRDGLIQSDERLAAKSSDSEISSPLGVVLAKPKVGYAAWLTAVLEHFRQGLQMLAANKVRTALSMLGIIIGVAAVIAMLAIGAGAKAAIEKQLSSLGSNLLVLRPGALRTGGVTMAAGGTSRLSLDDAATIAQRVANVRRTSSTVSSSVQTSYRDKNWSSQVLGTEPAYASMHACEPQAGRFFTAGERQSGAQVAVIGTTVVHNLFGSDNPLGATIKVAKKNFTVIGVFPDKGGSGFRDENDVVAVPVTTAMKRLLGKTYVDSIDIETTSVEATAGVDQATKELMNKRHRIPAASGEDGFQIFNLADIQAALTASSNTMSMLLAAIAGISLLVGGIGIMNIMLISVTERTKEIGLRKAIGGRRRDVMVQFLAESTAVSLIGGLLGIALGWTATVVVASLVGWATLVSVQAVLLAFGFSALIGIGFGLYPARRAALLSPIDALRSD